MRRKTRPGVDRIILQELRAIVGGINVQIDLHVAHCYQCKSAGADVYSHCHQWWVLAKQRHKAQRKLKVAERPYEDDQEMLPGMDTL